MCCTCVQPVVGAVTCTAKLLKPRSGVHMAPVLACPPKRRQLRRRHSCLETCPVERQQFVLLGDSNYSQVLNIYSTCDGGANSRARGSSSS